MLSRKLFLSFFFVKHKHWNIHWKHNITQMHKKHIAFPFWPVFLVAPEWHHCKASSWSERLFPLFPLWLLIQLSASPLSERLLFFKGCRVEGEGFNCLTVDGKSRCSPSPLEAFLTNTLCGHCRSPTCRRWNVRIIVVLCEKFYFLTTDCDEGRATGSIYFSIQFK